MPVMAKNVVVQKDYNTNFLGKQSVDSFEKSDVGKKNDKTKKILLSSALVLLTISGALCVHKKISANQMRNFGYSKNVQEALEYKNFSKIKYFKELNFFQRIKSLHKLKSSSSASEFFATLNGNKPACFLGIDDGVAHLKNNKVFLAEFDIINHNKDCFILNKKKLKEFISNNKDIYISRLGMKNNATVDEIYNNLLKSSAFARNGRMQDILGITLGFPKYSSMMFNLESLANLSFQDRNNVSRYKESLLKVLRAENSPYKNLNKSEFEKLEKCIEGYAGKNTSFNKGCYNFVNLADDASEMARVENDISKFLRDFSVKNIT